MWENKKTVKALLKKLVELLEKNYTSGIDTRISDVYYLLSLYSLEIIPFERLRKDSFLVFGDMDLIEMQPAFSPRGLLAKYLFSSDNNALQFEFQKRQDLISAHTQISTLHGVEQHDEFLNKTLAGAQKKITIISPWLSWQKVEQTGFLASMALARSRGIDITVVTDKNCNIAHVDDDKRQEKQHLLNDAVEKLNKMGIATKLVNRVHSKIVIEDEELLCVGSFNWFSAAREDKYQRYDTSLVYRGEGVKNDFARVPPVELAATLQHGLQAANADG